MQGLIILANGFEDSEAIITIDLLRRSKIKLDLVSLDKELNITSSHQVKYICDKSYQDINLSKYDFLIIPGGQAVFKYHLNSNLTKSIVKFFMDQKRLVACICAAPMILGVMGYLKGKNYTCFPGCESSDYEGHYQNQKVVVDGNIITAQAMGATFEFCQAIITKLESADKASEVIASVYY